MSRVSATTCRSRCRRSTGLVSRGLTWPSAFTRTCGRTPLALFGFATLLELQLFQRLIGITGIGPRLALAVLSGIEAADLVRAVRQGDVARLTGIPGVGKKTAERIGLELKDRLPAELDLEPDGSDLAAGVTDMQADLLSALLNLGYQRPMAERAVSVAIEDGDGTIEQTLKRALKELAR